MMLQRSIAQGRCSLRMRRATTRYCVASGAGLASSLLQQDAPSTASWNSNSCNTSSKRTFSYQPTPQAGGVGHGGGGGYNNKMRAYPVYSVFGENCLLSLKMLTPYFRVNESNILLNDSSRKGRILLEWIPRTPDGRLSRNRHDALRFALSAEEVGLLLDQLPANAVEFTRKPSFYPPGAGGPGDVGAGDTPYPASGSTAEVPDKVLRISPREAGSVSFAIDHELNGVGGQAAPTPAGGGEDSISSPEGPGPATPLEVVVQLGEFQVMRELMRTSIPILTGWSTMVEVAMQRTMEQAQLGGGSPGIFNSGGGGGFYNSGPGSGAGSY